MSVYIWGEGIINLIESQLDMLRRRLRGPILLFIGVPFILLAPVWMTGKAMFWGVPILQFVPWRTWAWEALRSGQLPLWNPLVGMGAPLVANYQSGLFYPPNWLYFLLAAAGGVPLLAWGQAVLVAAHMVWAAMGMGYLARRLGLHELGQMISGLSFGLSGYLVARSGFLSINAAVAWVPWVVLGVTGLAEAWDGGSGRGWEGRMRAVALLALALGMQLLAGHAQTAWYTLILAGLWGGFLALVRRPEANSVSTGMSDGENSLEVGQGIGRGLTRIARITRITRINPFPIRILHVHPRPMFSADFRESLVRGSDVVRRVSWVWAWIGLAAVMGAGLAAVQLLPTGEYLMQSQRSAQVEYEMGMTYSFWPWRFLTMIAPDMFGSPVTGDYWGYANYWEDAIYIGLLPLLLALGAISRGFRKGKARGFDSQLIRFLVPVVIVSFVLALGTNTPVFAWLYYHVPTFDMFQAPSRLSLFAVFGLCLLGGIGAEYWRRPAGRGLYWTRLGTAGAVAVALGAGLAWAYMGDIRPTFIRATALAGLWGVGAGVLALVAPKEKPPHQQGGSGASVQLSPEQERDSGTTVQLSPEQKGGRHERGPAAGWWFWGVGLVVAADLLVAGWGLNPGIDMDVYQGVSQGATQVASKTDGGRIYLPEDDEYRLKFERYFRFDTFHPEGGWPGLRAALIPDTNMLDNLPSANNFDPLLPKRYSQWIEALNGASPEIQTRLLNLMGVEVVERVGDSQPYEIRLEKQAPAPRFRWIPCALVAKNGEDALQRVILGDIDFEGEVVLETEDTSPFPKCQEMGESSIQVTSSSPNQVSLEVQSEAPGYVFAADTWYPGWQARVDGAPTQIYRANYLFRAVRVPAGRHEVRFVYRSVWFMVGALVSVVVWAIVGIYFLWWRGLRYK